MNTIREEHDQVIEKDPIAQPPVRANDPRPADRVDDPAVDDQR